MRAGLIDDFISNILSVPFCPYHAFFHIILSNTVLSVCHFVHTILSVPFCPLYHFALGPYICLVRLTQEDKWSCKRIFTTACHLCRCQKESRSVFATFETKTLSCAHNQKIYAKRLNSVPYSHSRVLVRSSRGLERTRGQHHELIGLFADQAFVCWIK